jgi:hypothetical protein
MMSHPTSEARLEHARRWLIQAGPRGVAIRETTPANEGLPQRDVQALVDVGLAEWIEPGARAKATDRAAQAEWASLHRSSQELVEAVMAQHPTLTLLEALAALLAAGGI